MGFSGYESLCKLKVYIICIPTSLFRLRPVADVCNTKINKGSYCIIIKIHTNINLFYLF